MRSKLTYGLLVGFLVFLITANPSGTGESGREFLGWMSGGWDDTREFVSSLMGEENGTNSDDTNDLGEVVIPTVAPEQPANPPAPAGPTPATDQPTGGTQDVSVVE